MRKLEGNHFPEKNNTLEEPPTLLCSRVIIMASNNNFRVKLMPDDTCSSVYGIYPYIRGRDDRKEKKRRDGGGGSDRFGRTMRRGITEKKRQQRENDR